MGGLVGCIGSALILERFGGLLVWGEIGGEGGCWRWGSCLGVNRGVESERFRKSFLAFASSEGFK